MKQAKIFRKVENNSYSFKLADYAADKDYSTLIKTEKTKGYRQVIINSEIMIKIILLTSNENMKLRTISFNDAVDPEYQNEINQRVSYLKKNPQFLSEFIADLAWTCEQDSIDIEKVDLAYRLTNSCESITIICNGVVSGTELILFFQNHLHKILKDSF